MKVLFLNYEYPPLGGGAANATSYILHEFSKIPDLEVDLVTSSSDNEYHLEKIGENIKIHKLPINKSQKNLHHQSLVNLITYTYKAYFFSNKLIKKFGHSYNLTHSFFTVPCGFLSLIFKIKYKIPYVISLRGSDVPGYSERFKFLYGFIKPFARLIWKNSSAVVSNSQGLKELALKSKSDQKIDIIYNGIDINIFHPDTKVKDRKKFIVTLGGTRITPRKGIKYLIEAVHKLVSRYPQIYVTIIGEGSEKESLENLSKDLKIKDRITFLDRVDNHNIPPYYQEASVFILPSLNEGMSNAMLEALASGLPIVATDTGGTQELVKDGVNGFIIKMKNSQDIADKLEKIITNDELCQRMGDSSRKIAENLSWEKVALDYLNIYKKISE